jgi:hypothetical protein
MQLNGAHTSSNGKKRLVVTSSVLDERAKKADEVRKDFAAADDDAMKQTGEVGNSLKGFRSASAFTAFTSRWQSQMKYVEGLLEKDVAGALRASAQDYRAREQKEAARHRGARSTLR